MSNQTNSIFRKTPRAVKIFLIIVFFLNSLAVMTQSGKAIGTPWDGEEVFNAKGCNNCHSVNGVGGRGGPDLRKDVYYGTYLELASLMWNHYPKMSRKMNK
ncbi:MAG: c-type cytochrome, partial [Fidelibacterota bacterium]